jgi:hypothetical protein
MTDANDDLLREFWIHRNGLAGCGKTVLGERFFALVASFRQS